MGKVVFVVLHRLNLSLQTWKIHVLGTISAIPSIPVPCVTFFSFLSGRREHDRDFSPQKDAPNVQTRDHPSASFVSIDVDMESDVDIRPLVTFREKLSALLHSTKFQV